MCDHGGRCTFTFARGSDLLGRYLGPQGILKACPRTASRSGGVDVVRSYHRYLENRPAAVLFAALPTTVVVSRIFISPLHDRISHILSFTFELFLAPSYSRPTTCTMCLVKSQASIASTLYGGRGHGATASHVISTAAEPASATAVVVRVGYGFVKKVVYTAFIAPKSVMFASHTTHEIKSSILAPAASAMLLMLASAYAVSFTMPPVTRWPAA